MSQRSVSRSLERRKTGLLYYDRDNLATVWLCSLFIAKFFLANWRRFIFKARTASFTPIGITTLTILASIMASIGTTTFCVWEAWISCPLLDTVYQFRSRCLRYSWQKSRLLGDESSCRGLDYMKSIRSVILPNLGKGSASERETDPRDGSMKWNISAGRC